MPRHVYASQADLVGRGGEGKGQEQGLQGRAYASVQKVSLSCWQARSCCSDNSMQVTQLQGDGCPCKLTPFTPAPTLYLAPDFHRPRTCRCPSTRPSVTAMTTGMSPAPSRNSSSSNCPNRPGEADLCVDAGGGEGERRRKTTALPPTAKQCSVLSSSNSFSAVPILSLFPAPPSHILPHLLDHPPRRARALVHLHAVLCPFHTRALPSSLDTQPHTISDDSTLT